MYDLHIADLQYCMNIGTMIREALSGPFSCVPQSSWVQQRCPGPKEAPEAQDFQIQWNVSDMRRPWLSAQSPDAVTSEQRVSIRKSSC